jgi:hypothetical protein
MASPPRSWIVAAALLALPALGGGVPVALAQSQGPSQVAPGAPEEDAPAPVVRPPFVLELRSLAQHTDNVFRTESAGVSDTRTALGFAADIRRDGRMLDYGLRADLDWEHFVDGSYRDSVVGVVDLGADWGTRSDPFQWTLRDTFTQSRLDPVANVTPDNLENVNLFSTGPGFNVQLGSSGLLRVQGLYSKASYEESDLDSDSLLASVGVERVLSSRSVVGAYAVASRTEFSQAPVLRDFDVREYFVRYEADGRRTRISADAGYATLEERAGRSSGSPLLRASVQRRTAGSTLYARAEQRFASSAQLAQGIGGNAGAGAGGFGSPLSAAGALESRAIAFGVVRDRPRTSISLEAGWRDESYESDRSLDRSLASVQARLTRRLRPTLSLTLSAGYESEDAQNRLAGKADYTTLSAELEQRVGRKLRLFLGVDSRSRSGGIAANRYSEGSVALRVVYSLAERGERSERWSLARL